MRQRGFTLIEIVVAMAILGVGLIVIIELFAGGLRLGRASEEYSKAVSLARMKLEEISLNPILQEGNETGEFDKDFRWQVAVTKMDLLPVERPPGFQPLVEFYRIKVEVLWKSGVKERIAGIETYKTVQGVAPGLGEGAAASPSSKGDGKDPGTSLGTKGPTQY
jgi:prepilin-type N-terminal cleavage/methylation domain-containing protein